MNCIYECVCNDCLYAGFSPLSGASYKALNFSQIFVDSACLGFDIRVAQQKQGRGNAEALVSLSPISKAYRSHKTVVSYGVLFILPFVFDLVVISLIVPLHLH